MKYITLSFLTAIVCLRTATAVNINVPANGNLQSALNSAHPGDVITLAAGATYTGNFMLAYNPGPQWITIQSSAMSSLPAGTRVSAAKASFMPKLVSPNGAAVIAAAAGASYYRVQGIEVLPARGTYAQDLIQIGTASESFADQLPHDFDFDRDYIHGDPKTGSKRGIALNGKSITVQNCYMSAFTSTWQDTQALEGWNGPGPFVIKNNYLEAGTETIAFGGAVPSIPGMVPSDILVQNNSFFKPLSWRVGEPSYAGVPVWVKTHFELKNAQRVTIDHNVFENNWVGADQRGFAFVFTVRTESNQVPWAVVNNVRLTNNIIRHSAAGINFLGHDDDPLGAGSSAGFVIQNNVWQDITSNWGGDGRLFQILNGVKNVTIDHNTAFEESFFAVFDIAASQSVNFTNNIAYIGGGVASSSGGGTAALTAFDKGGIFTKNALIGGSAGAYPANNYFPASVNQVGFVNFAAGNYALAAASPYKAKGTDGKDLGVLFPQ
jgi:hypothetical protein